MISSPSKHSNNKRKVPKEVWRILIDTGDPGQQGANSQRTQSPGEFFYYILVNHNLRKYYGHNSTIKCFDNFIL